MSDDDLDALLDDALETFDSQQEVRRTQREKQQQEEAATAAAAAAEGGDGGGDGVLDPAMLSSLMNVLSQVTGGAGGGGGAEADLTQLHTHVEAIITKLQSDPDTTEEEKARLTTAAEYMRVGAAAPDEQMTNEQVEEMRRMMAEFNRPPDGGEAAPGEGELDELLRNFSDMQTEALVRQQQEGAPSCPPGAASVKPPPPPPPPGGSRGGGGDGQDAGPPVPEVMRALLEHPDSIIGPFRAMRDAYPGYLAEHGAALSDADRGRYTRQMELVTEICSTVGNGTLFQDAAVEAAAGGASPKHVGELDRFTELVEQLQALGEPPQFKL